MKNTATWYQAGRWMAPFGMAGGWVCRVVLGCLLSLSSALAASSTVTLVYEPTANPPRVLGEGPGIDWQKPGITLELLQAVAERLNIAFTFQRVPWQRGLFLVEHHQVDGIFHASFQPDRLNLGVFPMREGQVDPSRSLFTQRYLLYKHRQSPVLWDGQSLRNLHGPIGVLRGYSIQADLERQGQVVEASDTLEQLVQKLLAGRLAAFTNLENMTDLYLADHPQVAAQVVQAGPPLVAKPYYLMFSKGFYAAQSRLAEEIWDTIAIVTHSQAFQDIVRKYP